jgi:hypothetical protein
VAATRKVTVSKMVCCAHPDEDVPEVAALSDLVEIGQQDGHDHAGLDPLAEEDDEGGNHRGAIARSRIV